MPNKNDWDHIASNNIYEDKIVKRCTSRICVCLYMILPLLGVFLIEPPIPRICTIIMIVLVIPYIIWNMHVSEKRQQQLLEKLVSEYHK